MTVIAAVVETIVAGNTARAARERGEQLGIQGAALDLFVRDGAPQRHEARVQAAIFAALAWALVWDEEPEESSRYLDQLKAAKGVLSEEPLALLLDAWAILSADLHGVGGRHDAEGRGTDRHPGLDRLGKGRKQATDGPAWDAAIRDARFRLEEELAGRGIFDLAFSPNPRRWSPFLGVRWTKRKAEEPVQEWQRVACLDPRWVAALAVPHVLAAEDEPEEMRSRWVAIYNRACAWRNPTLEWVAAIRDGAPAPLRASLWTMGTDLDDPEAWPEFLGRLTPDEILAVARAVPDDPAPVPTFHADHGVPPVLIAWAVQRQQEGFFVATVEVPGADLPCGLHGPAMGDAPIPEEEVIYQHRSPDRPPSRMVSRPPRRSDLLTVIGVRGESLRTSKVFTAYGGPAAPREPGDPSLNEEEREVSAAFWAQHALATGGAQ